MSVNFHISQVSWSTHTAQLKTVREQVFIVEQQVAPEFEWDDLDAVAIHLLAQVNHEPIACARIIKHKKIGRMAVLNAWRGLGVGNAILCDAIAICQAHGSKTIDLTAQTHAIPFYQQAGFIVMSGVYQDANIPHVDMRLVLAKSLPRHRSMV